MQCSPTLSLTEFPRAVTFMIFYGQRPVILCISQCRPLSQLLYKSTEATSVTKYIYHWLCADNHTKLTKIKFQHFAFVAVFPYLFGPNLLPSSSHLQLDLFTYPSPSCENLCIKLKKKPQIERTYQSYKRVPHPALKKNPSSLSVKHFHPNLIQFQCSLITVSEMDISLWCPTV